MTKLLILFIVSMFLAFISERNTRYDLAKRGRYSVWNDWAYILLVVILTLFAGLRTQYNDTWNYISGFERASGVSGFLANSDSYNPFKNPLFGLFQSVLKSTVDNAQVMIFLSAAFTQICFLRFFKRYSEHFTFSVLIYFTLGTFVFTLAAIKQVLGMAILTLAFPYLQKKQWGRFYLVVAIAMLVHTYAMVFAILPLLQARPWRAFTFAIIALLVFVLLTFETTITAFMDQANDLGKTLAEFEVFGEHTINLLRLAVYAVPPLISLVFQRWIFKHTTRFDNLLIHMSIVSLAFMSLGTQAGANMFARMAMYFELGTICCLPKMLKKAFDKRSNRVVAGIAVACFVGFFVYSNAINIDFGQAYEAISLWEFIKTL